MITGSSASSELLTAARPKSPYPGLRPFEVDEWSIFFGRERMIDEVVERLADHHLVMIHGSSGSGKSSLVRAGVLPKLARQHLRAGAPWQTCSIRPSGGPLWNLAKEFARLEGRGDDVERVGQILGQFNRRGATLSGIAGSLENLKARRLCILVDQFEELFRFEKETSREEAELFVDLLVRGRDQPRATGADTADPGDQSAALLQHPTGFFSGDAREQLRLAEAEPAAPAQRPGTATRIPGTNNEQEAACRSEEDRLRSLQAEGAGAITDLKTLEQSLTCERLRPLVIAALDRANPMPNVDTPEQVRSAQGQLIRLGCFTGTADGRLDAATIAAILLYLGKQGIKPSGDVHITDDLIAELTKQSARVCPLVCPPGKVAARGQCIDSPKGKPTVARPSVPRPTPQPSQPNPPPRTAEPKPPGGGGGGARIGVTPGVGF